MDKPILIIDHGHGGKDGGGGSNELFKESDMALKISKYQQKRFQELGVKVAMTRTSDVYIDSTPRANKVKNSGAKYCISNHINSGGGEGAETIHSIHADGKLANALLDAIVAAGQKKRRVFTRKLESGQDYYFMHRLTGSVETVIIEYGFGDHAADRNRLNKKWKKYAEAVVRAFCEHIGNKYVAPGGNSTKPSQPSGKLYKVQIGAYKNKANADRQSKRAKDKGFDTYTLHEKGLYKIQIGAYSKLENAQKQANKAHKAGFDVYIEGAGQRKPAPAPKPKEFKAGQKVKIKQSAKKYSRANVTIPARVKSKRYTIQQVAKNDVLLKEIVSWVNKVDVE